MGHPMDSLCLIIYIYLLENCEDCQFTDNKSRAKMLKPFLVTLIESVVIVTMEVSCKRVKLEKYLKITWVHSVFI